MRPTLRLVTLLACTLIATGCVRDGLCVEPLSVTAGSDTALAITAALDTLERAGTGRSRGKYAWVATHFARRLGDTVEVGLMERCSPGTDRSGATVHIVPPARVVSVYIQVGG